VMRLFHGHDEVVTIPGSDQSEEQQRCEMQNRYKLGYPAARWGQFNSTYESCGFDVAFASLTLHENQRAVYHLAFYGVKMDADVSFSYNVATGCHHR